MAHDESVNWAHELTLDIDASVAAAEKAMFERSTIPNHLGETKNTDPSLPAPDTQVLVTTPMDFEYLKVVPFRRQIPLRVLSRLPLAKTDHMIRDLAAMVISDPTEFESRLALTKSFGPIPLKIKILIYHPANGFIDEKACSLLKVITHRGFLPRLMELLAANTPYFRIVRENIRCILYMNGDIRQLGHSDKLYLNPSFSPFILLRKIARFPNVRPQTVRYWVNECSWEIHWIKSIFDIIHREEIELQIAEDARVLLFICQHLLKDLSAFEDLWDANLVSVQEIEETRSTELWVEYTPLFSLIPETLNLLLQLGFRRDIEMALVQAIVLDDKRITLILWQFWDQDYFENLCSKSPSVTEYTSLHAWDLITTKQFRLLTKMA